MLGRRASHDGELLDDTGSLEADGPTPSGSPWIGRPWRDDPRELLERKKSRALREKFECEQVLGLDGWRRHAAT